MRNNYSQDRHPFPPTTSVVSAERYIIAGQVVGTEIEKGAMFIELNHMNMVQASDIILSEVNNTTPPSIQPADYYDACCQMYHRKMSNSRGAESYHQRMTRANVEQLACMVIGMFTGYNNSVITIPTFQALGSRFRDLERDLNLRFGDAGMRELLFLDKVLLNNLINSNNWVHVREQGVPRQPKDWSDFTGMILNTAFGDGIGSYRLSQNMYNNCINHILSQI